MKPQQLPRPGHLDHLSDDSRGYPVIATIGRDAVSADFGSINERRKLALATFDWCAVCGLPFNGEPRWQAAPGDDWRERHHKGGWVANEAPVHQICLLYAAQVCPYLSSPGHRMGDELRSGQRREEEISLVGFERTSQVLALRSGLQLDLYVLHFKQEGIVDEVSYSRPEELADRYADLLAREEMAALSGAEAGLVGLFNEPSDEGAAVTGAALMAGASFLKNVFKVQGMEIFAKNRFYEALAVNFMDLRKLAEFGEENEDPASRLVSAWVLERQDELPDVLQAWRETGVRIARSRGLVPRSKPQGSGRTVPKNAPCPCGSGRRAGRCHPAGL